MPKTNLVFICNECGADHPRWAGRCQDCGAWNSLEETQVRPAAAGPKGSTKSGAPALKPVLLDSIKAADVTRLPTGSAEFDRVLGGGIVPGSVVLLGGDPGIGKSTLLLQLAGRLKQGTVLYVSGEESAEQISLRAQRLGISGKNMAVLAATDVDSIIQTILDTSPQLVIIDSIQTTQTERFSSGPGSITQVRESAARLQTVAKAHHVSTILVGHVTKEGAIAGPRVLEHMVDAVLYLEGEKFHGFRLLRGVKNRFGPTDEVGVLMMEEEGLVDVDSPAGVFIDEQSVTSPGAAVTASMEGTRALLVEVQALGVETSFGYPKRTASGFDTNRLQLLIAVLTKQAGLRLGSSDIYANVSGGFRLTEPAADLAMALAIASAVRNQAVLDKSVVIGEIGLSGEIRPVRDLKRRLEEAARNGFTGAIIPDQKMTDAPLRTIKVRSVAQAVSEGLQAAKSGREVARAR